MKADTIIDGEDRAPVRVEIDTGVAVLSFARPHKRNAINDATAEALRDFFSSPPEGVRAAILVGEGGHFSAGIIPLATFSR